MWYIYIYIQSNFSFPPQFHIVWSKIHRMSNHLSLYLRRTFVSSHRHFIFISTSYRVTWIAHSFPSSGQYFDVMLMSSTSHDVFVSCHLILSNLITLCSYVMHFRSRGAIERQSNTLWPTWDDTQTLPSLNMPDVTMCAQQLVYTNTTGGCKVQTLRFYSQSQISWILEAARFDDKMVLSEVW